MKIGYKKCHANSILIVCVRCAAKNTMVNVISLNTLTVAVRPVAHMTSETKIYTNIYYEHCICIV